MTNEACSPIMAPDTSPETVADYEAAQSLTAKQTIFIEAIAKGMSKSASCQAAGLNPAHAARVLNLPQVQAELHKIQSRTSDELQITRKDIIEEFYEAKRAATNTLEMVAALREIAKLLGLYETKVEINIKSKVEHIHSMKQLEHLSDEDLAQLAELGEDFVLDGEFEEVEDDV